MEDQNPDNPNPKCHSLPKRKKPNHRHRTEKERQKRARDGMENHTRKLMEKREKRLKKASLPKDIIEMESMRKKLGPLFSKGQHGEAKKVYEEFRSLHPQTKMDNSVLQMMLSVCLGAGKSNVFDFEAAAALWEELKTCGGIKESSYHLMIQGYCRVGKLEEALGLLKEMEAENFIPRWRTYSSLLECYNTKGDVEGGFTLWAKAKAENIEFEEKDYLVFMELVTKGQDQARFHTVMEEFMKTVLRPQKKSLDIIKLWFQSPAAGGPWTFQDATVDDAGTCSACQQKLRAIEMCDEDRSLMLAKITSIAIATHKVEAPEVEHFRNFTETLSELIKTTKIDAVVDGANVGYALGKLLTEGEHATADLRQIDMVVKQLEQEGANKVMIVLHERHLTEEAVKPEDKEIPERWAQEHMLVEVPKNGMNDDFYWVWATMNIGGSVLMVTNDQMRDHHFALLSQRLFQRWRERHMTSYKFSFTEDDKKQVTLGKPPVYSTQIQKEPDGSVWHIPDEETTSWCCIRQEKEDP